MWWAFKTDPLMMRNNTGQVLLVYDSLHSIKVYVDSIKVILPNVVFVVARVIFHTLILTAISETTTQFKRIQINVLKKEKSFFFLVQ